MFDFDKEIKRKGTNCSKWGHQGGDFIPMWVADMDFPLARQSWMRFKGVSVILYLGMEGILKRLQKR